MLVLEVTGTVASYQQVALAGVRTANGFLSTRGKKAAEAAFKCGSPSPSLSRCLLPGPRTPSPRTMCAPAGVRAAPRAFAPTRLLPAAFIFWRCGRLAPMPSSLW